MFYHALSSCCSCCCLLFSSEAVITVWCVFRRRRLQEEAVSLYETDDAFRARILSFSGDTRRLRFCFYKKFNSVNPRLARSIVIFCSFFYSMLSLTDTVRARRPLYCFLCTYKTVLLLASCVCMMAAEHFLVDQRRHHRPTTTTTALATTFF